MNSFPWMLAHLLIAYLIVHPILGARDFHILSQRLASGQERRRNIYYRILLREWTWVLVIFVFLASASIPLNAIGLKIPSAIIWNHLGSPWDNVALGLLMGLMAGSVVVVLALLFKARTHEFQILIKEHLQVMATLLPSRGNERTLFAAVCITAAICEELLYRGFLQFYLSHATPGISLAGVIAVSSVAFGAGHLYQGWKNALGEGFLGVILALLYWACDSLLLPMAVHALSDMMVLSVWRPDSLSNPGHMPR